MKNFFKKLSFVMAAAMVVTSLHVPAEAKAASKDYVYVKGSKKAVTTKSLFVGGQSVNFDYVVGSLNNKGANGKWSVTDSSIATVDNKGVVKAVNVGETELIFTAKKSKKVKKEVKKVVKLTTYARAESVSVSPAALDVVAGKTAEAEVTLKVKEELEKMGVKSSYMTFAEVDNTTAAAVKIENGKLMVEGKATTDTSATIKVYAAQKNTLEEAKANKYVKTVEVKLNVVSDFTVEQAGSNKVRVKGHDLSDDIKKYSLKSDKGSVVTMSKKPVLNADKTEAVLEAETIQINPGKYVLTYAENKKAELMIEKSKIAKIQFIPSDKAIAVKSTFTNALGAKDHKFSEAFVMYQVFDQFGDDITKSGSFIYDLNVNASVKSQDNKKGLIKLVNKGSSSTDMTVDRDTKTFNINFDKVNISIVDKKSGQSAIGFFTVVEESKVAEVTYAGIYSEEKRDFVDAISEADAGKKFRLAFEVKDQYGFVKNLEGYKLNDYVNVIVSSATNVSVNTGSDSLNVEVKGKTYATVDLVIPANVRTGEVDVLAISLFNGKNAAGKFSVGHRAKVAKINIYESLGGVYNNMKNELVYQAYDLDNKPVTSYKLLKEVTFEPAGVAYFEDHGDKVKLIYDTTKDGFEDITTDIKASGSRTLTYKTVTNEFRSVSINVKNQRKPVEFLGFKADTVKGVTSGNRFVIGYDKLRFRDQYGAEMTAKDIAKLYTAANGNSNPYKTQITFKAAANNVNVAVNDVFSFVETSQASVSDPVTVPETSAPAALDLTNANVAKKFIEIKATADMGNVLPVIAEIQFLNGTEKIGDPIAYNFYNVDIKKMTSFGVETPKLQPVADLYKTAATAELQKKDRTYILRPSVYGYFNGDKIALGDNDFQVYAGIKKDGALDARPNFNSTNEAQAGQYFVNTPLAAQIKNGNDVEVAFEVIILDGKATRVASKAKVSKEAPKVDTVKFVDGFNGVIGNVANAQSWTSISNKFTVLDQYGGANDTKPFVTFTAQNDGEIDTIQNGGRDASFKLATGVIKANVNVKLSFPGASKPSYDFVVTFQTAAP